MYTQKRRPVSDHDLLALLSELIAIDSCDPPGRELEIADYLAGVLGDRGIEAEVDEFAPGRANLSRGLKEVTSEVLWFFRHISTRFRLVRLVGSESHSRPTSTLAAFMVGALLI